MKIKFADTLLALLLFGALLEAPVLFTGCGSLAPAGVYSGDKFLYDADYAIASSYDALHTYVNWEYQNRAALAGIPDIKAHADSIRAHAKEWLSSALTLRDAYAGNPTAATRSDLQKALDTLRAALVQAVKYQTQYATPTPQ